MAAPGILFVISAPSGGGKRTVLERVMASDANLEYSVSATTRQPREGETDGVDYMFLDRAEFDARIEADAFAEWADVHRHRYGTLHAELERVLATGKDAVLELDVQGMRKLREAGRDCVTVFITAPSLDALERRLRSRGTDSEEQIAGRMETAKVEIAARHEFDYIIVNDEIDEAVADMEAIVRAERLRPARQSDRDEEQIRHD
jgi:guanylate kinase